MLLMKFDYDWPAGLREIPVWKCGRTDARTPARVPYYKLTLSLRLWWAKKAPKSISVARTDTLTDARTPAWVPYYKLTLSLRLWWAKNRQQGEGFKWTPWTPTGSATVFECWISKMLYWECMWSVDHLIEKATLEYFACTCFSCWSHLVLAFKDLRNTILLLIWLMWNPGCGMDFEWDYMIRFWSLLWTHSFIEVLLSLPLIQVSFNLFCTGGLTHTHWYNRDRIIHYIC